MHLVRRVHFLSRDKDGGHTIGSAIPENPMLHTNIMALSFTKSEIHWMCKTKYIQNRSYGQSKFTLQK